MSEQAKKLRDAGPRERARAERRSGNPQPQSKEREVEQRCDHISNFRTAAGTRLMEASTREEVYTAIQEILALMLGAEELALFECGPHNLKPTLVWSCGINPERLKEIPMFDLRVKHAALTGTSYFSEEVQEAGQPRRQALTACVALRTNGKGMGVLAIFRLLPQKPKLEWSDRELLRFLEFHAAKALEETGGRAGRRR